MHVRAGLDPKSSFADKMRRRMAANRRRGAREEMAELEPIACFHARSLPQTPMISFGIGSTPLPRAVARRRTRYLFERHRLLAAAVSACRCRWNGAVFLSNWQPSRECRIGGPGRDLVQTWDSSFYRLRICHRSNTVCPDGRRSRRRPVEIRAGPPRLLAAQEL
jgi:hypothetical protein